MPTDPLGEGVPAEPLAADDDDDPVLVFNLSSRSLTSAFLPTVTDLCFATSWLMCSFSG